MTNNIDKNGNHKKYLDSNVGPRQIAGLGSNVITA